jgi:hypothetical protein
MKKTLVCFLFLNLAPVGAFAQAHLQASIPEGWVNVSEKVGKADTDGIPDKLIKTSLNSVVRVLAADPKTFKDVSATYLLQVRIPQMESFNFTDAGLRGVAAGIEESVKGKPNVTLVENKIEMVKGAKILRSAMDMIAPVKNGETATLRIVQYYLPDVKGATAISFYTLKSKAKEYAPVFEKAISDTLK